MNQTNQELKFVNYNDTFSEELSTWITVEQSQGQNGLRDFVVVGDVELNEYLDFIQNEMSIETKIALSDDNTTCGFICYSEVEKNHVHIECLGVNPSLRKMGIAKKLLVSLKNKLKSENPDVSVTLAVKKTNVAGIRSFSKVATEYSEASKSEEYLGMKL